MLSSWLYRVLSPLTFAYAGLLQISSHGLVEGLQLLRLTRPALVHHCQLSRWPR